ncbi:uncharacterized protein [Montipora capricornis]|uniref:uncharacterized protein n=1 Tax=Montipora capricornis TaxID=246305 RepID=UPI0035F1021C
MSFLKRLWPRYRGIRAGRLVQERSKFRRFKISTIQQRGVGYGLDKPSWRVFQLAHNTSNCVCITPTSISARKGSPSAYVPSLYLSNVMSLAPKIDEVCHVSQYANLDCVCITESWLRSHIHHSVVALSGFNLVRKDRVDSIHGGVCAYIRDNINFTILEDLEDSSFEALWLKLRPARLPRGYSCIVLGIIYHPPNDNDSAILDYLWQSLSSIESRFPNCGLLIVGDFNRLKTKRLQNSFDLKQIVTFPTRGDRTLDLVLTNLKEYYQDPIQRPPHGLSDHMSVEVQPKDRSQLSDSRLTIKTRDLKPSNRLAMRTYLQEVDVHTLVGNAHGCAEKVSTFQSIIQHGLDSVLPLRSKTIHSRDPPWVNSALKDLIKRRQRALAENNQPMFRFLRNRVNRERKICRQRYYDSKVSQLKECKPSAWWNEVKKLSGMSSAVRDSNELMRSLQHISEEPLSALDLANLINDTFLSPMQNFTPLSAETFQLPQDHSTPHPFAVAVHAVYLQLASINPRKASGPDGIPAWLFKENADLLSDTITDIINCSFGENRLPPSWKSADTVPIPKQKPIKDVKKHLRPISLTPLLSKVAEEFVVAEHLRRRKSEITNLGPYQYPQQRMR